MSTYEIFINYKKYSESCPQGFCKLPFKYSIVCKAIYTKRY